DIFFGFFVFFFFGSGTTSLGLTGEIVTGVKETRANLAF
ncbi:hypothetical protein LCGC14_2461560, partial [marine sediment metagenome]